MRLLKLVPDDTNIDFLGWRWWAFGLSVALIIASVMLVVVRGLNFGIDFEGGQLIRANFQQPVATDELRGMIDPLGLGEATIQQFGSPRDISIRLPLPEGGEEAANRAADAVKAAITRTHPDARFDAVETVSGKVSGELIWTGAMAIALAMLGIAVYIWFRFEWQFGIGALFALFHDVALTIGFFALTQLEFDLNVVAAILTIVGYSLNDTIVVYDRIRENLRKWRRMDITSLLNLSVNETLSRTIVTSLSMILALTALVVFGGEVLFGFSAAMLLGIFVGTFSSIYVSAPLLIWLNVSPTSFVPPADGDAERIGRRAERSKV